MAKYVIRIKDDIHNATLVLRNYLADILDKLEQNVVQVETSEGYHNIYFETYDEEIILEKISET